MRQTPAISVHLKLAVCLFAATTGFAQEQPPFPNDLVAFRSVRSKPIFTGRGEGHWDTKIRERGWILKEAATYRMWYTGYDGTREGIKLLGYATSKDGIHWDRRATPLIDDLWIEDMMVLKHQGRYLMVAEGKNDQSQLLTSKDGLTWKREGRLDVRLENGEPIPPGPFGTPTLFFDDGSFHLFYERRDAGVWLAKSTDLTVWKNVSDQPVLKPGPTEYDKLMIASNQIVKRGDWFYMYYHGTGTPTKPRQWCTCIAASRDLVKWTKFERNPLLPVEQNKSSGILVGNAPTLEFFTMHDRVDVHRPSRTKSK
ncbi:MAG: glycosylase [Planctomycetaceae bacterium]